MNSATFASIIQKHTPALTGLAAKKKYVVGHVLKGSIVQSNDGADKNAALFSDADATAIDALLSSTWLADYATPVVVDLSKAVALYATAAGTDSEKIDAAFTQARVNFMGTDGIRGKVVLSCQETFVADLLRDNAFTPELVETTAFSFAEILKSNGMLKIGDTAVIGNDGRDIAYDWALNNAVARGFNRAGMNVLDMGIVPTAFVPAHMLKNGFRGGAVLTASHNPANQNGIKFFIDGKKLLPEGALGDYVLSAYMFHYGVVEALPAVSGSVKLYDKSVEQAANLCRAVLPPDTADLLKGIDLVLDNANGSFGPIAEKMFNDMGITWSCVNETPKGSNINKGCGVAEIEGTEHFAGVLYGTGIPAIVTSMFDKGRKAAAGTVFGIALDGDGDRGFLLCYDKATDGVFVVDGDKCGYILAEYMIKSCGVSPKGKWFVSTIESDLMTAASAAKNLGLSTKVVSVGDKWIGAFSEGELMVGLEVSGHLIFPITLMGPDGKPVQLLSGIGLLTGLMTLVAARKLNLSGHRIVEPFEPGMSKTHYVFFVDKTKFFRGSAVWNADAKLVTGTVSGLVKEGKLPADTKLVFEDKEDANVLYINLADANGVFGCVFMRNSGTEDKTATYVKGRADVKDGLLAIGSAVQKYHTEVMKNENRIEYRYEKFLMAMAAASSPVAFAEVKAALEKDVGTSILDQDLYSVVYGLKKEGRIALDDQMIRII